MKFLDFLIQQYDFVVWADDRCLTAAAGVPEEGYRRDVGFSFGSVHNVLVHMMGVQLIWLGRLNGDSTIAFPSPTDVISLEDLRRRWDTVHEKFTLFVRSQTEASLLETVHYTRRGELLSLLKWQLLTHVFDHATYHRSQLNSMIKLAGGSTGEYGFAIWARLSDGYSL